MAKKIFISVASFIFCFFVFGDKVFAQDATASGVAIPVIINANNVRAGVIVCSGSSGYKLCDNDYDSSIYGVVTLNPATSVGQVSLDTEHYVIHTGIVSTLVTSANGAIKDGDLVTTSKNAGVAVKAIKNGYVLGTALSSYDSTDTTAVGSIFVSINIHPTTQFSDVKTNLIEILKQGLSSAILTPLGALRYILAAIVIVSSFILAFVYFGRIARSGIEGVARNPLAQRRIQFIVVVNILITLMIFIAGLALAYIILAV